VNAAILRRYSPLEPFFTKTWRDRTGSMSLGQLASTCGGRFNSAASLLPAVAASDRER